MIGRPSVMLTPESSCHCRCRIDLEAEQLDRDVPLVVIHRDHGVILPGAQLHEHGVAGHGPDHVEAVGDGLRDRRRGNVDILPAEQAALAGMRIERGDRDLRPRDAHRGSASWVRSITRRSRSGVRRDGTSCSATWVETWLTRMLPCASSITEPRTPVSAASISVWPG